MCARLQTAFVAPALSPFEETDAVARDATGITRPSDSARGVFISVSERQKDALARPFKELLAKNGIRGFIVSDEPRPEGAWTPEEKVDAYLDLSDAVVVFATGDLEAGGDRYTRPNIGDEIGRARSKAHLRDRVSVLKEHGVILPSNIDPAYEALDPASPDEAFLHALVQLQAWGLPDPRPPGPVPSSTSDVEAPRSGGSGAVPPMRYTRTSDRVTIAYSVTGNGPALIALPSIPFSNVLAQWRIPPLRTAYRRLADDVRLVLYDGRGTGQSQRDVTDLGLEATLRDLDAVVDHVGAERFALLGYYYTTFTAVAYAARHPERVTHLVLFAGAIRGEELMTTQENRTLLTLVDRDWDFFIDSAARTWMGWSMAQESHLVADAFRSATSPTLWRAYLEAGRAMDVSSFVASVTAPTLVLHRQGERQLPLETSRRLAGALPNGRLLPLEGSAAGLFFDDPVGDAEAILSFLTEEGAEA
jgi:pimeloyl-ACP methyl ester carboxylesterase